MATDPDTVAKLRRLLAEIGQPGSDARREQDGGRELEQRCDSASATSQRGGRLVTKLADQEEHVRRPEHCLGESVGNLAVLRSLVLVNFPKIQSLPHSIGLLTALEFLKIKCCNCLTSLPESIGNMLALREIKLSFLVKLKTLPEAIGKLTSLKRLKVQSRGHPRSDVLGSRQAVSLPASIWALTRLLKLTLWHVENPIEICKSIGALTHLCEFHFTFASHEIRDVAALLEPLTGQETLELRVKLRESDVARRPLNCVAGLACALPTLTKLRSLEVNREKVKRFDSIDLSEVWR